MKKFGKFLASTAVLAGLAAGAYYVYKNFIEVPSDIDDDDILDADETDDEEETTESSDREYISIDIAGSKDTDEET